MKLAFTLLEMMAVIFLMSIVLFVAIDFYLDLSRASNEASASTRSTRRAVVLLDRVARDLEGAVLVQKPDDVDPLAHPWLFLAESDSSDSGADRVKFIRRGHHPAASDAVESDLEMVSWIVADDSSGEGDLELRRWSVAQLPESLERDFPDAENSDLVAGGLASFGIKFQGEAGEWTGRWDSTTLTGSSELPLVAEIEVSFRTGPGENDVDGPYTRKVLLPLRPIDLEEQLAAADGQELNGPPGDEDADGVPDEEDPIDDRTGEPFAEGGTSEDEDDQGGKTVQQCLASHPELMATVNALMASNPQAASIIESLNGQPASSVAGNPFIQIPPDCL
jgi:type II secretory pathway component PulJ